MDDRDVYVLRMSESGDWFIVPLEKAESFWEDELNSEATYAQYVDLQDLQIYEFDV